MASPLGLTFDRSSNSTKIGEYTVIQGKAVHSLFNNRGGQFSPFPSEADSSTGNVTKIRTANDIHKDETNDISISSIVDYTQKYEAMKLDYSDFAYLKNVGVYPNNRLVIARRFAAGVGNDLTSISSTPLATLISWVKDGEDFISVSYNEEWMDAESSFEDVLNDVGKDVMASKDQGTGIGSLAASGAGAIPLPGFMEGIQYQVMKNMGLTDAGIGNSPLGNPNLIREAKRRKTLGKGEAGSGVKASFSIKMEVEYEQKFINGVDPTIVYMDIIQNALTFGTSDSQFQFNSAFGTGVTNIIKDLISGDLGAIAKAIQGFVQALLDAISQVGKDIINALIDPPKDDTKPSSGTVTNAIEKAFASTIGHVISKYKIRLIGVANALTGSNSTPWHVTIGNPKKPLFCSGDMLCKNVQLTVGKNLAFNDLPSYIKISFELENARNLGAQEVFNRFNTGKGRSYVRLNKSFVEAPDTTFATASSTYVYRKDSNGEIMKDQSTGKPIVDKKNTVTPTSSPQVVDGYIVDFGDDKIYKKPDSIDAKIGDNTTAASPDNNPTKIEPSNQSGSTTPGATTPISASPTPPPMVPGSVPLSNSQISHVNDSDLSARSSYIDDQLKETKPTETQTYTDSNGVTKTIFWENPKYGELTREKNKIKDEQEDRAEDKSLGITSNVQAPPNSFFQEPDPLA